MSFNGSVEDVKKTINSLETNAQRSQSASPIYKGGAAQASGGPQGFRGKSAGSVTRKSDMQAGNNDKGGKH